MFPDTHSRAGWLSCCLGVALATPGCAWRSGDTEYLIGPARVTQAEPDATGHTRLLLTRHLPLLLEGGRNWSISLGRVDRLRVVPREPGGAAVDPTGSGASRTRWSWAFRRVRLADPVVFTWRSLAGVRTEAGPDGRGLSVGLHQETATRPGADGVYVLEFSDLDPAATRLEFRESFPTESPPPPTPIPESQ